MDGNPGRTTLSPSDLGPLGPLGTLSTTTYIVGGLQKRANGPLGPLEEGQWPPCWPPWKSQLVAARVPTGPTGPQGQGVVSRKITNLQSETVPLRTASPGQSTENPILGTMIGNGTEVHAAVNTSELLRTRGRAAEGAPGTRRLEVSQQRTHEPERTQAVADQSGQRPGTVIHGNRRGSESASTTTATTLNELRQRKTSRPAGGQRRRANA